MTAKNIENRISGIEKAKRILDEIQQENNDERLSEVQDILFDVKTLLDDIQACEDSHAKGLGSLPE